MAKTAFTTAFAKAIVKSDPSKDHTAMGVARMAIIDFLACTIAGANDRTTSVLAGVIGADLPGKAILVGSVKQTDPLVAAVLNGYAGHVLDYDDVHASVRGHPTTVIVPALLALAAERTFSAEAFIASYVVGLEAMARLGLSLGSKHYENGFHATATLGPVGVAAAICHLNNASVEETAIALGLAATQASGLRLQFGFDAKPYHAGMAARSGLLAARLAAAGFGGAPDFLDNPVSLYAAYAFGAGQPQLTSANWGRPWQIVLPGLTLKAYPCCTASHPVASLGINLHGEGLDAEQINTITFTYPPGADAALVVTKPSNGIEARFSAEYVFSAALLDGALRLDHFDERPVNTRIMAVASRASRQHDTSAPRMSSDPTTRFVVLDIALKDGSTINRRFDGLPGVTDPTKKFQDATAGNSAFADIPDLVRSMRSEADLAQLLSLLNKNFV
ncbi:MULTISPECIES: MmgE/PrpD family protein [Agrobacterium]|uniref:MmgE/PrpD family protein n=1 Tax=Agrobacterium rosae TaxID=1972867 RepID=A0A1R3TUJ4_9HYPH|nr:MULTISPECIES: MmgE/PrpD family protein [Agrobacterium]MDX8303854.1 MmgE/PrpD family protein [Agrobacterium rosae]MDX8313971.1 MmgE/PrpD family protein [Agrobacterium rosae]POO55320.1 MmgE/PrpD family protein [Agrobacterium rosae]SCX10816.1 MmgE/PrpD family protein [Agrobacterium sp. DSM 25558]SCX22975.1 MmgE/PrpD family protein [Agrobacterium rosae]